MKHRLIKFPLLLFFIAVAPEIYGQRQDEGLFSFEPDARIFTLHAFMNMAGFDHEWRKAGMDTLRVEIRETLKARLTPNLIQRMKKYRNDSQNHSWAGWARYGLVTDGCPNFEINYDKTTSEVEGIAAQFEQLSPLLKEFCAEGEIDQLWTLYQPLLKLRNERYKPYAHEALDNIIKYCRLEDDFLKKKTSKIHFQVSPLMSYFTAQTVKVNGEIWLINSPSESEPGPHGFYHEALHHVIDALVEQHPEALKRLEPLNKLVENKETAYEIVIESFVRTFDKLLQAQPAEQTKEMIFNEYALGFVLCPIIYESIPTFEASNMSISEFVQSTLSAVDIETETERWKAFNTKE